MTLRSQPAGLPRFLCRALALAALGAVLCLSWTTAARANPELDEAKRLVGDLEFEASLAAFDAALESGRLTRAELVDLLSERAFVFHALRRQDDLVKDFIWLSALAPDYRLDLRAPPDLTATWTSVRDQGRGLLKVELSAQRSAEGVVDARASLTGTVPDGARARLWLRRGDGAFALLKELQLHESESGDKPLAFYADGLALGGVVLPGVYDAKNPLRVESGESGDVRQDSEAGWASRHKGWLIGAAALVAAAGIVTGVLLTRDSDEHSDKTNINPMVSF
jgi:uncharacterized protein (DUF736 family)